jgi:hypothetical protein
MTGKFVTMCLALALVGLGGCATMLRPAPEATRVPGRADAAVATDAGVQIVTSSDAWRGYPGDLDDVVTPLLLTFTNDSGRRLALRYEALGLVTPGGVLYAAVAPFDITGWVFQTIEASYPAGGFTPYYYSSWYPGGAVYGGSPYRVPYYGGVQPALERVSLPSGDMVQKALPEGVIAPGGRVSGFVFFEKVEDVRRVTFVARLIDASTGEQFGEIAVPFVVERRACHNSNRE